MMRSRVLALLLALALLAAACGGGDDDDVVIDGDGDGTTTATPTATATTAATSTPTPSASPTPAPIPSATPTAAPTDIAAGQPTVLVSSDDAVVLVAPTDEIPEGTTVTIEPYQEGAQWPQELIGMFAIGRVYELGPTDLALSGPITITVRLDAQFLLGDTAGFGANVYLFLLSDGEWSAMADLQSEANANALVLTATTLRLGVLAAVFGDSPAAVVELLNQRRALLGG